MNPQKLLRLESCLANYNVKATLSGITLHSQNKFKKRYTGSKTHAVDINGKLWIDLKELKKIDGSAPVKKAQKKGAMHPCIAPETKESGYKFTEFDDELPTHELDFLTNLPELSTSELIPIKKGYTVNAKEVRARLLGMINTKAGKKELYFWTITFPKGTADDIAYRAFNIWLTTLRTRDKFGRRFLRNYLWVAERQENGTVHFHIAIPHRMPVKNANGAMQTILRNLAAQSLIPFSVHQCKRYNGVDIAKNRNTKRVTNFAIKKGARALTVYLTKYITKNVEKFQHLAWHNSRGFSALFTGLTFTRSGFMNTVEKMRHAEGGEYFLSWMEMLSGNRKSWRKVYLPVREGDPQCPPPPAMPSTYKKSLAEWVAEWPEKWKDDNYLLVTFIPWKYSCPKSIVNHLADLNSYIQDVTAKN